MAPETTARKAKVCMVGDAAVGKSSLVRRFVFDEFSDKYTSTLGVKTTMREVRVRSPQGQDVVMKIILWDIMGETTLLETMMDTYFHGAQGIVAVCDLTRFSTFENLREWLQAVQTVSGPVPKALAVNKVDLKDEAMVLYDEYAVKQYAEEIGARSYKTSAKTGENVEAMFQGLAEDILAWSLRQAVSPTP